MTEINSHIIYNNKKIFFELKKSKNKRTKNITIKIKPEGKVIVSAPRKVTNYQVLDIVNKRADWIYSKIEEFKAKQKEIPKYEYISGEEHYYLGDKFQLNRDHIKEELLSWYNDHAFKIFTERFDKALLKTYWVKTRPNLVLKFMKSQWGSCSSTNKICLNIHLIKTPIDCIDYVIYHELCHVLVKNHSKQFYKLLEEVCPNWKEWRKYLKDNVSYFIN